MRSFKYLIEIFIFFIKYLNGINNIHIFKTKIGRVKM